MKNDILDRIDRFNKGEDIKFRIGVDQDWVLAKLTEKWVDYYNTIFNDNLDIKNIKTWNIIDFIKPEARDFMLNILNNKK
jgi:5'(3')-deoxyribonucleotidase